MQTALDLQNNQLKANSKLIDIALAQIEVAKEYQASVRKRLDGMKSRLRALEGIRAGLEARLAGIKAKCVVLNFDDSSGADCLLKVNNLLES